MLLFRSNPWQSLLRCCALITVGTCLTHAAVVDPVHVTNGQISGAASADGKIKAYKGIPYGAPPTGDNRWRPPMEPKNWTGVRKATEFSPACSQALRPPDPLMRPADGPQSEDCLYLNVWTPAASARESLPVLVWIHGGGFRNGSSSMPHYDGEALARKGIVVVSINYRLGAFGFLAHPELTAESPHHSSGNYALLDMIAALNWTNKNIAAFGGNPNHVTIMGQSAGASGIEHLMVSPMARGLFVGAIAQSGGIAASPINARDLSQAEQAGVKFAQRHNATTIAQLRAMPPEELRQDAEMMGPDIDGWVVSDTPYNVFAAGNQAAVPILYGSNGAESVMGARPTPEQFVEQARKRYGHNADKFLSLYPVNSDEDLTTALRVSGTAQTFYGMKLAVQFQAKKMPGHAYLYFFNHAPPLPKGAKLPTGTSEAFGLGAYHGSELVYMFGTLQARDWPWTPVDFKLSEDMVSYWANFAKKGDPNGQGLPEWPAFSSAQEKVMEFADKPEVIPTPLIPNMKFLDEVSKH